MSVSMMSKSDKCKIAREEIKEWKKFKSSYKPYKNEAKRSIKMWESKIKKLGCKKK